MWTEGLHPSSLVFLPGQRQPSGSHSIRSRLWLSNYTRKLGKSVQYKINDLRLCRPGFYVPAISESSRAVHMFVQDVTYRQRAESLDGQIEYILCRHLSAQVADGFWLNESFDWRDRNISENPQMKIRKPISKEPLRECEKKTPYIVDMSALREGEITCFKRFW